MPLSDRLTRLMDERGLKPAALAKVLGVHRQTVYVWMKNPDIEVDYRKVLAMADFFGVDAEWLEDKNVNVSNGLQNGVKLDYQDDGQKNTSGVLENSNAATMLGFAPENNNAQDEANMLLNQIKDPRLGVAAGLLLSVENAKDRDAQIHATIKALQNCLDAPLNVVPYGKDGNKRTGSG